VLIVDFNLSHSMAGLLYALPILMIALFSYPLGILSDRIGMEASIGYGTAIAVAASFLRTFSMSFDFLVVSTVIFGLGFAFCFPNLPKLVKERFPPQLSGTVTGVYTTAIPFGTGLAMVLTRPILALTGGWRNVLLVWSVTTVPAVLLWWIVRRTSVSQRARIESRTLPREDEKHRRLHENTKNFPSGRLVSALAVCGLVLALLNLIFYCTIGWLPTYLIEHGWAAASAATATSFISFIEIPAMFLVPLLSDRTGRRRPIVIMSFVLMAFCSGIVSVNPSLSWFTIPAFGVTMGGVFSLLLSLPVELVEAKKVGRAAGAIISIGYTGALIGPPVAGYLRDVTGNFSAAFLATAFLGLAAAALSYWLPKPLPIKK
jgi:CP family cyanate transporter-like MFS transporter